VSGGSALDNLYIADGVNITDSAFGGIGTFSRSYGGLGTGITTAFVKEVQIKTAGFEPQYGQSEGGVVNIITQSGGNEYQGNVLRLCSKTKYGRWLGGLNLGPGIHFETGVPISELFAHPAYLNAGEIPVGGRGSLGRTNPYFRFDMHADYPWHISEKKKVDLVADFFNVFNSIKVRLPNQNFQLNGAVTNVDFLQPQLFYLPFNMRLGMRSQASRSLMPRYMCKRPQMTNGECQMINDERICLGLATQHRRE